MKWFVLSLLFADVDGRVAPQHFVTRSYQLLNPSLVGKLLYRFKGDGSVDCYSVGFNTAQSGYRRTAAELRTDIGSSEKRR